MNLSLFTNSFEPKSQVWSLDSKVSSTTKSPRNFEGGVVGLGIVAALNDLDNTHDSLSSKPCKASILAATSPRSNPIPIANRAKHMPKVEKCRPSSGMMEMEMEMEMSESYTCVISHCGNNLIKKRVYFDDKPNGVVDDITTAVPISSTDAAYWVASEAAPPFKTADFLSSCYLCQKKLHGLDIFMYRYRHDGPSSFICSFEWLSCCGLCMCEFWYVLMVLNLGSCLILSSCFILSWYLKFGWFGGFTSDLFEWFW